MWKQACSKMAAASLAARRPFASGAPDVREQLLRRGRVGSLIAASAAVLTNLIMWYWSDPGWGVGFDQLVERLGQSPAKRSGQATKWSGPMVSTSWPFCGNRSYSNRLAYLEPDPDLGDKAYARGAT